MKPIHLLLFIFITIIISQISIYAQEDNSSIIWYIERTDSIGGYEATKLPDQRPERGPKSELPIIIETKEGKAALFNGINQGLLVKGNPLENAEEFTIEMVFRPDTASRKINFEQRFLHIQEAQFPNRRILLELRALNNNRVSYDSFIRYDTSSCTLFDSLKFSHPIGKWYHMALVYKNGIMKHYINGVHELTGEVNYVPLKNAYVSIGARQDPRSWFKGVIRTIKFSKRALKPEEFSEIKRD